VWLRVVLDPRTALAELHEIIQVASDWDDEHLHLSTVEGRQSS